MNFFKIIFGNPFDDSQEFRSEEEFSNNFPQGGWEMHNDDDNDENILSSSEPGLGIFNFPLFRNPADIEKHFDNLQNEMEKIVKMFGFHSYSGGQWHDENSDFFSNSLEEPKSNAESSLRDSCFKTPEVAKRLKYEDKDLDGKVTADEVIDYLNKVPGTNSQTESLIQYSPPRIYSKSVYIREIRRPDGSVETIKKVVDHTGKEETTITQNQINNNQPTENGIIVPKEDTAGVSLFKKFFPF